MKRTQFLKKGMFIMLSVALTVISSGCGNRYDSKFYSTSKLETLNKYLSVGYLYGMEDLSDEKIAESIYTHYVDGLENLATYYLSMDSFKQAKASEEGNYWGIGIQVTWERDGRSILVTNVIPNSPAEQAGVKSGDHIIKIDGIQAVGANEKEVADKLTYMGDEAVSYTLESDGKVYTVELTSELIELEGFTYEVVDGIGYIELKSIKEGISEQLKSVLDEKKPEGLILDIRGLYSNNLEEISLLCDLFLNEGIAFKVQNKENEIRNFEMSEGAYDKQVVLLTDNYTRGAIEALVSALEDRTLQIGTDTYGLSYVSEMIELEDGSGLSVATGILYDRYSEQLSDKGITPDLPVYMTEKEKIEYIETGSVSKENDSLLQKALEQFS